MTGKIPDTQSVSNATTISRGALLPTLNVSTKPSLHLVPLDQTDPTHLFSVIDENRNHLSNWLPWPERTTTVEDTRNFIELVQDLTRLEHAAFFSVNYIRNTVGVVGSTRDRNSDETMLLNYWISEKHTSNGFATTATKSLIDFLRRAWNIKKFKILTSTKNECSVRVAKKLAFDSGEILPNHETINEVPHNYIVYRKRYD